MPVGKVMKHHEKGTYGWILSQEDGKSIFFHMDNLNPKADELPPVDTLVEFDVGPGKKKGTTQALNIRQIQTQASTQPRVRRVTPGVLCPPYHFVPIPTDGEGRVQAVTDAPVFHDGKEQLFSGELRCTLTAWTPLLAAN